MVQVTLMFPHISHILATNKRFRKSCNHKQYMMILKKKIWTSSKPGLLLTITHRIKFTLQLSISIYLHYQMATNCNKLNTWVGMAT